MKKTFFFIVGICAGIAGFGQAKPSYTQYVLNNYILNPAVTGIENYVDVKFSNRNQWTGIAGAPVTTYVSIHGPIGKSDLRTSATSFQVPGENPRGKQYWEEYTAPAPHHGIGFMAMNDKAGYVSRWSLAASYAYHKPLGVKTTLAAGINAGFNSVNVDQSKIDFADLDQNDPAIGITSGELKKIKPEIGVGLWLYSAKYFAGISVLNIIPGKFKFVKNDKYGTYYTPNYFLTAGYRVNLDDNFNFIPSVMVQYWEPQLLGLHANAKLQYQDKAWIGASYRYGDLISGYSAMAGVNVANFFNVSYSYEVATTGKLRAYTGNTHEIMIGFIIGNKYGDTCPRNVW
ncbi:type IX secretion system membrane protein PorP/SprF [Ferruginibacter sp. HRS2-29]|uniref:PorP/SprF family type IX secretion system membrane protein n=1 Tax=Ferruginibacter sp. HRS2-29 TaxID=2487334 RepID=UPI0020CF826F|nr:type IX secretion system membrane protein PorP/SprF [Ferruginibacter sp. HRS2-29]MCP9753415.1 type IX secretion system membrane protein PorP/SprF [Ferruginibacter sp. HRS2-29]